MGGVSVSRLSRSDLEKDDVDLITENGSGLDEFTCPSDRCGRTFPKPVSLTNLSHRPRKETYYACPFCFSRLKIEEMLDKHEISEAKSHVGLAFSSAIPKVKKNERQIEENKNAVSTCKYGLGYLRSRSKGSEIPDDCLTCPKILQCMSSS